MMRIAVSNRFFQLLPDVGQELIAAYRHADIDLPNLLATPHIGGSAKEAWEAMARAGIRGVEENAVPEPGIYPFD